MTIEARARVKEVYQKGIERSASGVSRRGLCGEKSGSVRKACQSALKPERSKGEKQTYDLKKSELR